MSKLLRLSEVGAVLLLLGVAPLVAQEVVFTAGPAVVPTLGGANGGFAWLDVNGDGTQDVFIPPNNVLLNYLTYFTQVASTKTAALTTVPDCVGGLFADINGDGVPDIWSTNNAAPKTGLFYDVSGVYTVPTGTGELAQAGATGSVFAGLAVADIDHSNYLSAAWHGFKQATWSDSYTYKPGEGIEFLKGGPGGFTRVGNGAAPGNLAIDTSRAYETWDVHFLDANNDGYQDLFMPSFRHGFRAFNGGSDTVGAKKGSILFLNDGTGKFYVPTAATVGRTLYALDSLSAGVFYARAIGDTGIIVEDTVRHFNAIGSVWGDLNNDGNVDLLLTGTENNNYDGLRRATNIVLLYGKGDGTFTFKWNGTKIVDSGLPTSGSLRAWDIGDYNNDGIPDVFGAVTFGIQRLWRGNGDGTFSEVTTQDYVSTSGGRAGGLIDYNNDGFLDTYMHTGAGAAGSVLSKNGGNSNHWIGFTPVGMGHNLSAVGAKFTLYTQGGTYKQYRYIKGEGGAAGHGEMRALFGIGINTSIDSVVVNWPDGSRDSYQGLAIDRYWTIKEGSLFPSPTSLVSPANNTVAAAQVDTLKWTAATNALAYHVQVSLDPTFANKALLAVDKNVTGTTYVYTLGSATKYYWRVAAVNNGFMSDYTSAYNFTTAGSAAAAVPIVVSPANKALQNTIHNYNAGPVLKFVLPPGKTLANYSLFTFKGDWAQGDVGYKDIVVEAYQTMPTGQFANSTTNRIGVWNRAKLGSNGWENDTVSVINSSSMSGTIYVAFGINCAGTGDVGGTGLTTIWYADNVTLIDTTSKPNTRVSVDFESNSIGDPIAHIGWSPSDIQSVVVRDPTGTGITLQPASLTLAVHRTADASRYQWQVATTPAFTTFFTNATTADTTYAGQFNGGQTFYLRVRGVNDLGASAFSEIDTFTIVTPPPRTTLVSPANNTQNVISDSVAFFWRVVSTAASYNLQLSNINSTVTYTGITDTAYKVYGLSKLTNYTWKVEAINAGGTSYYTSAFAFTTILAAPGAPNLVLPASGAASVNRLTRFVWNSTLNAAKYRLQVATDNAFTAVVRDSIVYDTTAVLLSPLDENTDYYWRVNGQNIGGVGGWAAYKLFTTGTALAIPDLANEVPQVFDLYQNYPNPFNPSTTISFDVPKNAQVNVVIYDILGRVVTTLVDEMKAANRYRVVWDASNMSTGVYFYRMTAKAVDGSGNFTSVKKLLLMK
jgi:hypothetical protein